MATSIRPKEKSKMGKKRRNSSISETKQTNEDEQRKKKTKISFTEIEFKVLLRDPNNKFNGVEKFVEAAQSYPDTEDYDIVGAYLRSSPDCIEILQLLETKEKRKPQESYVIFQSLECILIRTAGDLEKFKVVGQNIVRKLLSTHLGAVYAALSISNKSSHIKAALKLLTAMVMQGAECASSVMVQFDFTHRHILPLLNRRDTKDRQDVRTCLLYFLMSILVVGDKFIIKQLVETKGLLNAIFSGMFADKFSTLQRVLPTLLEKIVENPDISKTSRIRLFNDRTLKELSKLYSWKGPSKWNHAESQPDAQLLDDSTEDENQVLVHTMIHDFLIKVCCHFKLGVNFFDKSYGTGNKNMNHILTNLLTSWSKPAESPLVSDFVTEVLLSCPDQLVWYLPSLKHSLTPRVSPSWMAAIALLAKIYGAQPAVSPVLRLSEVQSVSNLVRFTVATLIPPKEVWAQVTAALKNADGVVRYEGLQIVLIVMRRLKATIDMCHQGHDLYSKEELHNFIKNLQEAIAKLLPDVSELLKCWAYVIDPGKAKKQADIKGMEEEGEKEKVEKEEEPMEEENDHISMSYQVSKRSQLCRILQVLCLYQTSLPNTLQDRTINHSSLLAGVRTACSHTEPGLDHTEKQEQEEENSKSENDMALMLQLYMLKFLAESDTRQMGWMKESVGGQSTLRLLLEMSLTTRGQQGLHYIATNLLSKLLSATGLFENAEEEIHVWLKYLTLEGTDSQVALTFLEKSISELMKDPYTYTERVTELAAEAVAMETSLDALDTASVGTTDALIDSIISMEEEDLNEKVSNFDKDEEIGTSANSTRLPFSPLVVTALNLLQTTSDKDEMLPYVQAVVLDILCHQVSAVPLSSLISKHSDIITAQMATIINKCLPNISLKTPKKKKKKAKDVGSVCSDALLSLQLWDDDYQSKMVETLNGGLPRDSIQLTKQLLLGLSMQLHTTAQEPDVSKVSFCFELLSKICKALQEERESESLDLPETIDGAEFSSLKVAEPSQEEIRKQVIGLALSHPDVQEWFLKTCDTEGKKAGSAGLISGEVTAGVAGFVQSVGHMASDLLTCIRPYVNKLLDIIDREVSKEKPVAVNILQAIEGFQPCMGQEDRIHICEALLKLPEKSLIQSIKSNAEMKDSAKTLTSVLSSLLDRSHVTYALPFTTPVVRKLVTLVAAHKIAELDTVLLKLLQSYPAFSVATDCNFLHCCLDTGTETRLAITEILVTSSSTSCKWLRKWFLNSDTLKLKKKNMKYAQVIHKMLTHSGTLDKKIKKKLKEIYWDDLTGWVLSTEEEGSKAKQELLTALLPVAKPDKVESLWVRLGKEIVGCGGLEQSRLEVYHAVTELLDKAEERDSSDESDSDQDDEVKTGRRWQTYVTHCVTGMSRQLSGKTPGAGAGAGAGGLDWAINSVNTVLNKLETSGSSLGSNLESSWESLVKYGLRSLFMKPEFHKLMCHLMGVMYGKGDEEPRGMIELTTVHSMIMSHSQFLPTMLTEAQSQLKERVVEVLLRIVELEPGCCQSGHIAVLLGAYGITLSRIDQQLLLLMNRYEENGCSMSEFKPYLWGTRAVELHSIKKTLGPSLLKQPTVEQCLEALDPSRLIQAALSFPLRRRLQVRAVEDVPAPDTYDPAFLLPFFCNLLMPGSLVPCGKFVEIGCLGYVFAALSSHDAAMRGAAMHALTLLQPHVEGARLAEKEQVLYLLSCLRNSIGGAASKLAPIITVFLARAAQLLMSPTDHLYQVVNGFLLLKPAIDTLNVPEFYKLFNSADEKYRIERTWILSLLHDGLRETADYRIYEKRYSFKLLLTFYSSPLSDQQSQVQVLKIVKRACQVKTAALDLVKNHALLTWLSTAVLSSTEERLGPIVDILNTLWMTMLDKRDEELVVTPGDKKDKESAVTPGDKMPCLPVVFTNLMLSTLLDVLNSSSSHFSLGSLRLYLACLASVLSHLEKTEQHLANVATTKIRPVTFGISSVVKILSIWSVLYKNSQLQKGLENFKGSWINIPSKTDKKAHTSPLKREKELNKNGSQDEEDEMKVGSKLEFEKVNLGNLVSIIGQVEFASSQSNEKATAESLLSIYHWSLQQVLLHLDSDLDLLTQIVRSITRAFNVNIIGQELKDNLLSDCEPHREVCGQLLALYQLHRETRCSNIADNSIIMHKRERLEDSLSQLFLWLIIRGFEIGKPITIQSDSFTNQLQTFMKSKQNQSRTLQNQSIKLMANELLTQCDLPSHTIDLLQRSQ